MKAVFKSLFVVFFVLMLVSTTGCASILSKPDVEVKPPQVSNPSETITYYRLGCSVPPPPTVKDYEDMSHSEREKALGMHILSMYAALAKCKKEGLL